MCERCEISVRSERVSGLSSVDVDGTECTMSSADDFFASQSVTVCTSPSFCTTFTVTNTLGCRIWRADFVAQEREVVILPGFDDPVVAARL